MEGKAVFWGELLLERNLLGSETNTMYKLTCPCSLAVHPRHPYSVFASGVSCASCVVHVPVILLL